MMITPEILQILVWPFIVLLIAILFLILFKKDIGNLLNRLEKAKLPGGTETFFNYGEAGIDKSSNLQKKDDNLLEKVPPEGNQGLKGKNSGNVFWAGHDLMWTIDVIIRGAPRETIVHGLNQSLHHIRLLGLAGTPIEARLSKLTSNAEKSLQEDWTIAERNKYAEEVATIVGYIGKLAEMNQVDFEPNPK